MLAILLRALVSSIYRVFYFALKILILFLPFAPFPDTQIFFLHSLIMKRLIKIKYCLDFMSLMYKLLITKFINEYN